MTLGILLSVYVRVKSSNGNILEENAKWDPTSQNADSSYTAQMIEDENDESQNYMTRGDLLTQLSNNAMTNTTNPYVENHSQSLGRVFSNKFSASPAFGSNFLYAKEQNDSQKNKKSKGVINITSESTKNHLLIEDQLTEEEESSST